MSTLWVRSIYGMKARQPLVELHHQDMVIQLDVAAAREVAGNLLQAAEAAEQDAFLFQWSQAQVGCTDEAAVSLLRQFRMWREARREGPPTSQEHG